MDEVCKKQLAIQLPRKSRAVATNSTIRQLAGEAALQGIELKLGEFSLCNKFFPCFNPIMAGGNLALDDGLIEWCDFRELN